MKLPLTLLGFTVSLLMASSLSLQAAAPLDDTEVAALVEEPEMAMENENTSSKLPVLEIHGDYRWLFGKGRFSGNYMTQRQDAHRYLAQRRLRVFPTLHITPELVMKTMVEDDRYDKDHENNPDHHLFLSRMYLEYVKDSFKAEAGRFNYFLADGNVIDKKVDGVRLRYKHSDSPTGRFAFFYGKTADHGSSQKEGFILENRKEMGKWLSHLSYLDFHTVKDRKKSTYPFLQDARFDKQRIGEWTLAYSPNTDWQVSMDFLYSSGEHKADQTSVHETGYVASLHYGEAKPEQAGTWEAWIRYYNQPSSSIIAHTMDGDTTFFQRMGFKGWGIRCDYVVTKGLVWAVEGFSLKNKKDTGYTDDFHEYVIGTSLTAYF